MTNISDLSTGRALLPAWPVALVLQPLLISQERAEEVRVAWEKSQAISVLLPQSAAYKTQGNVAIIPIQGPLLNAGLIDGSSQGFTSYGWLMEIFKSAAADPNICAVLLQINSPGGVVSGLEGARDALRKLTAAKHVIADVEGMAASAAYWLASQAHEIHMTALSQVGSIGVYTVHHDFSRMLAGMGIEISLIASGERKAQGHPYAPLSADAKAQVQTQIDELRRSFALDVALGRKDRLTFEQAMATEAAVYVGRSNSSSLPDALSVGLADRICSFEESLSNLQSRVSPPLTKPPFISQPKGKPMTEHIETPNPMMTLAEHAAALEMTKTEGIAEGRARAFTDVSKILALPEAKGREQQALAIALQGIAPDAAQAILQASPLSQSLGARMVADPVPDVGFAAKPADPAARIDANAIYAKLNRNPL